MRLLKKMDPAAVEMVCLNSALPMYRYQQQFTRAAHANPLHFRRVTVVDSFKLPNLDHPRHY
ncbi:MAG: hypothetical protein IIC78_00975 [Chloroflexi bacterium]|nr:hypothetical protein [Chloroflexota bacterium]